MGNVLLEIKDIKKYFRIKKGLIFSQTIGNIKAVDGVNFQVFEKDIFGIVGESGCGKTTILKMILLLENITDGHIYFRNEDITKQSKKELKRYRRSVQAMFQDPYSSLNPRMKIWEIISEPMRPNLDLSRLERKEKVRKLLKEVKLNLQTAEFYPHEFSGGQRQRIALARSIAIQPSLVILDEPVSALDVSVRAQLMNLLMDIQEKLGLTFILIAHDLAVVRHMCNRVAVMYLGKIVEYGDCESVYTNHFHPYTMALLSAALPFHPDTDENEIVLPGEVPNPINSPSGCHFHPRCLHAKKICSEKEPILKKIEADHRVACHFWNEIP